MNRKCFGIVSIGLAMTVAASASADEQETLKPFVAKVIKAASVEKMQAARAWTLTLKETDRRNFSRSGIRRDHVQLPDCYRSEFEFDLSEDESPVKRIVVVNGQRGWRTFLGKTEELSAEELGREKKRMQQPAWIRDVALLSDLAYELAATGEVEIGGRTAVGIKPSREEHPSIRLYFDKETGRLLKTERQRKDGQKSETIYGDYRDVGGILVPHKWTYTTDGNVDYESGKLRLKASVQPEDWVYKLTDLKFADKLDGKLFEKP